MMDDERTLTDDEPTAEGSIRRQQPIPASVVTDKSVGYDSAVTCHSQEMEMKWPTLGGQPVFATVPYKGGLDPLAVLANLQTQQNYLTAQREALGAQREAQREALEAQRDVLAAQNMKLREENNRAYLMAMLNESAEERKLLQSLLDRIPIDIATKSDLAKMSTEIKRIIEDRESNPRIPKNETDELADDDNNDDDVVRPVTVASLPKASVQSVLKDLEEGGNPKWAFVQHIVENNSLNDKFVKGGAIVNNGGAPRVCKTCEDHQNWLCGRHLSLFKNQLNNV